MPRTCLLLIAAATLMLSAAPAAAQKPQPVSHHGDFTLLKLEKQCLLWPREKKTRVAYSIPVHDGFEDAVLFTTPDGWTKRRFSEPLSAKFIGGQTSEVEVLPSKDARDSFYFSDLGVLFGPSEIAIYAKGRQVFEVWHGTEKLGRYSLVGAADGLKELVKCQGSNKDRTIEKIVGKRPEKPKASPKKPAKPMPKKQAVDVILNRYVEGIIYQDSKSWMMNRYDRGSAKLVHSHESAKRERIYRVRYTYNGGQRGWVEIYRQAKGTTCLRYWDAPRICRRVR